jgi:hypothetical protein
MNRTVGDRLDARPGGSGRPPVGDDGQRRIGHKHQQRHPGQQPAPLPPRGPAEQVAAHAQQQRSVEQNQVGIEGGPEGHCQPRHRGQDHQRVGKDHRKDKAQEDAVQQRIVARPGGHRAGNQRQRPGDQQPGIACQQADRHVARDPVLPHRALGDVVAGQPQAQPG